MALFRAVREIVWLQCLLDELGEEEQGPTPLYCDNQGAIALAKNHVLHGLTKHMRWLTRDAAARLAICNHLPLAKCAHFGQHRTAQALDHFLALDPTDLTVDLLKQHLLAAETSVFTVGAARGTPRTPFFEGCSPSPLPPPTTLLLLLTSLVLRMSKLLPLVGSAVVARARVAGLVEVAAGVVVGAAVEVVEAAEVVAAVGVVVAMGALVAVVEAAVGVAVVAAVGAVAVGLELSVEVLEEARGSGRSVGARPRHPCSLTCGKPHTQHRCFSRLDDAWRAEFGDEVERPQWAEQLRSGVAIFDLDYDAILSAMYALFASAEGDCYRCVPPDPDSSASRCFFRDSTTLTPLPAPVPVRLADPFLGPIVACSSTVISCRTVPSGSLSGLHLPSFSTNLVSTAALQDAMVTTTTPGGQRVLICTCTRTGRHVATFTRRPGSSLYTLVKEPPQVVASAQVAASAQVSASGQVAPPCSCRLLSHQTLLWHHRLGHPSLPRLRGMHSRLLVSGLPRSMPPLPPLPAPPYVPCVEGRQRAAAHSSFPPTTAPLQILHMDVKGEVVDVLIRAIRLQLRERFCKDLPVLHLHSDRGGEFSSDLLRDFCRGEGILQTFTFLESPMQNGIVERCIGLVMKVARTSMIHAAAPHFLCPFAVRYAAHQLNLRLHVSLPETSSTLRWTGEVGDASVFRVWGSRAFVRDTSADKLSAHAIPYIFLGFYPDAPGWQFHHPTSRRVFPSQDVTFDKSLPFYHLFPYRFAPPPPPPLFLAPDPPPVDPLLPQGRAPSGAAQGAAFGGAEPGGTKSEGAGSGSAEPGGEEPRGAESAGVEPGGAEPEGVEPGGIEPEGVEPGGAESEGAESGGAEPRGAASSGAIEAGGNGDAGAGGAGAGGTRGTAAAGPRGARSRGTEAAGTGGVGGVGAGDPTEPGAAGAGGAGAGGTGAGGAGAGGAGAVGVEAGGTGAGGAGAGGARAVDPGAGGAGGTVQSRPYFVPHLQQVLGVSSSTGLPTPLLCSPPDQSQPPLQPASPLPAPSPLTEQTGGLTERRDPIVSRLIANVVTHPSFESTAASALVAELLDFAAVSPPSVGGECALGMEVLEDRQEEFECLAAAVPCFASMLLAPEGDPDAPDIPTPRSYAEAITGP
ncbi:unnamed protein product [Closterium sp. NIES-54]